MKFFARTSPFLTSSVPFLILLVMTTCVVATVSAADWMSAAGIRGVNGKVNTIARDESGTLYIGGEFTVAGELVANRIARWTGTNWLALGGGVDEPVNSIVAVGTNVFAAGNFRTAGGKSAWGVAQWNGIAWAPMGGNAAYAARSLVVWKGDLYAAGEFFHEGTFKHSVARWDGYSWVVLKGAIDSYVNVLLGTEEGLLAGGLFTQAADTRAHGIARWDGEDWHAVGDGLEGGVYALLSNGGEILAGGTLYASGENKIGIVAKWDGVAWRAMGTNLIGGVYSLCSFRGDIFAGGQFYHRQLNESFARWDGTNWASVGVLQSEVRALLREGDLLFIGGFLTSVTNAEQDLPDRVLAHIASWDGVNWAPVGLGMESRRTISALAVQGDELYIGGDFRCFDAFDTPGIAKWKNGIWSPLDEGLNGTVSAITFVGTNLYAGGSFTEIRGNGANHLALWNGANWEEVGGAAFSDAVEALATSGNDLYVGGRFTEVAGIPANSIAKWDGTTWEKLGGGMNPGGWVAALATVGSQLYAGGFFTNAGGTIANRIARWDGSAWHSLGAGVDPRQGTTFVAAIAEFRGDIYIGGAFSRVGNQDAVNIARWDGDAWHNVGDMNGPVTDLLAVNDQLYAVGWFTEAGGVVVKHAAKWNGDCWKPVGSGTDWYMAAVAAIGDTLYAGGDFNFAGGMAAASLARIALGSENEELTLVGSLVTPEVFRVQGFACGVTTVVLEGSSDLVTWLPVATNSFPSGEWQILQRVDFPGNRFYRARYQP